MMNTTSSFRAVRTGALAILLCMAASAFISVGAAGAADPITDDNVAERAASATTKADHEALAAYFDAQVAAAAAKVKAHEKMLTLPAHTLGKSGPSWETHCKSMIKSYKQAEADAKGLADVQRSLAAQAK